jgi:cytochrome c
MKKILLVFGSCAFMAACGGSESKVEGEEYYNRNSDGEVAYSDSTSDAEISASTRQSEVDTNLNDIGTDRTAAAPATTDAAAGSTTGAAGSKEAGTATNAAAKDAGAAQQNFEKGKNLIAMSDCLACHQVEKRLVGPGYEEVAAKYEMNDKNVDYLAGKIIKGGSGVWGQIPMTPHPDLKQEDAKEMAKYILSLKK